MKRRLAFASVALSLALGACGTKQTLEQAIQCDQFKQLPDKAWSTVKDVSLDYSRDGTHYQLNFDKGSVIKATVASTEAEQKGGTIKQFVSAATKKTTGQEAVLLAALNKKCGAKHP